jgi:hypothetical protein
VLRPLGLAVLLTATGVSSSGAQPTPGQTLIAHNFDTSAQGWRISGDTDTMTPVFNPACGRDGGCIEGSDQALGETWYFSAPDPVVVWLRTASNGTLSYWLKQSGAMISLNDDDIVIVGRAGRLSFRFPQAPGTDWTAFSVRLSTSDPWTWNWNRRATQAQIEEVLATATHLEIRGEYVTGDDRASLDTFRLIAAPIAAGSP